MKFTDIPLDQRSAHPPPAPIEQKRPLWKRALKAVGVILLAYYTFCVLMLLPLRFIDPPITGVQLQRKLGAALRGDDYAIRRTTVRYETLPQHVGRAIVAAEDGDFWQHRGFDFDEMREAGKAVFDGEMPRGASTITQQLMKNVFGTTSRNPVRKLLDMALTPPAELLLGKRRILELYLNNVEWARGVFGIEAAARHHYGVRARHLTRTQAAGLAALLPAPLRRTPANTPQYRGEILRRMNHRGW